LDEFENLRYLIDERLDEVVADSFAGNTANIRLCLFGRLSADDGGISRYSSR
jgi:hypothetical protein